MVRSDPDTLMIGEIRDSETAEMAVQSALTGHIVLSTLHTNDAAGAAPRLLDMGVEPFLLTSSINLVIAQRLARKLCEECKEVADIPETEIAKIKEIINKMPEKQKQECGAKEIKLYHGKGCKSCGNTGYSGRIGIFEALGMSEAIKELILKKVPSSQIQVKAVEEGMVTMLQDGIIKVLDGQTSLEEVWRVTKD
jgi:type II secretory ATPase GspE/PulE/Tfp pilus assembly ATPase PilB-like protein